MRNASVYIFLGFVLTVAGIFLILFGTGVESGGFVYVFPFFFYGTDSAIPVSIVVISIIATIGYFYYVSRQMISTSRHFTDQYIICQYCQSKMPIQASYCSVCGSPASDDRNTQDFY